MQCINLNKELCFENSIVDLLLISLDDQLTKIEDKEGIKIIGDIAVSGKINTINGEKEFSDKLDLDIFLIYDEIEDPSLLNVSIKDFNYAINDNKLLLNIFLKLDGLKEIEKSFLTEENFEDIQEEVEQNSEERFLEDINEEIEVVEEVEKKLSDNEEIEKKHGDRISLLKSVFSNKVVNGEVFWKLHCVRGEKSYEEIANKYNVDLKKLILINKNEEILEGKLIFLPLD